MKFGTLLFQNYGSFYGQHLVNFSEKGLIGIFGDNQDEPRMGSNGSGKSTVPDALDYCLFGEVPRKDSADSIINEEAGKDMLLQLIILNDDNEAIARIDRYRKAQDGTGVKFWIGEDEVTSLDGKKTQAAINDFIGMDRKVFHAAVLFAQKRDFDFADATDSKRKEVLTRILQLEEIDGWLKEAKATLAAFTAKIEKMGAEYNNLYGEWEKQKAINPQTLIDQWAMDRTLRLQNLEKEIDETQHELQQAQYARAALPEPPTVNVPQLGEALATAKAHYDEWAAKLQAGYAYLNSIVGGQCVTCGQMVPHKGDVDAAQQAVVYAQQEATKADIAWGAIQKQITSAQADQQAAVKLSQARANQDRRIQQLNNKLNGKQNARANVLQEVNPYQGNHAEHAAHVAALEKELSMRRATIEQHMDKKKYLEFWVTGFGPKGLKSYVLDAILSDMNEEMNRWIQLLTGGTHWVRCETQKQVGKGKKAKLVEDFSIRVFRHNPDGSTTERGYRSYSGGEKDRVGLGVDFGLSRLVAKRAKQSWDVLILDELVRQSIDGSGKDAIGDMLLELSKDRGTIMVIDHDPAIQGLVEKKIHVVKKNGRSRFEEDNEQQQCASSPSGNSQGEVHQVGAPGGL